MQWKRQIIMALLSYRRVYYQNGIYRSKGDAEGKNGKDTTRRESKYEAKAQTFHMEMSPQNHSSE